MLRTVIICAGVGLIAHAIPGPAVAGRPSTSSTPSSVQQLLACRAIPDQSQRLTCYDRNTDVLRQALATKEVVMLDKQRAVATKRRLFGFSVPEFGGLFGGADPDVKEISSSVVRVTKDPYGELIISLADGSTWYQTDDQPLGLPPERGDKVVVRRGSFGAFFLRVNGQPGIRVKRVG